MFILNLIIHSGAANEVFLLNNELHTRHKNFECTKNVN